MQLLFFSLATVNCLQDGIHNTLYSNNLLTIHIIFLYLCEGYSNETSGLCGSLLLGTGFVGAIASGILAEKTGKMEQIAKAGETLIGQCHEKNIFAVGLNILISTFLGICDDDFESFLLCYTISHYKLLVCFFEISY
jgi:hypothetical protein